MKHIKEERIIDIILWRAAKPREIKHLRRCRTCKKLYRENLLFIKKVKLPHISPDIEKINTIKNNIINHYVETNDNSRKAFSFFKLSLATISLLVAGIITTMILNIPYNQKSNPEIQKLATENKTKVSESICLKGDEKRILKAKLVCMEKTKLSLKGNTVYLDNGTIKVETNGMKISVKTKNMYVIPLGTIFIVSSNKNKEFIKVIKDKVKVKILSQNPIDIVLLKNENLEIETKERGGIKLIVNKNRRIPKHNIDKNYKPIRDLFPIQKAKKEELYLEKERNKEKKLIRRTIRKEKF